MIYAKLIAFDWTFKAASSKGLLINYNIKKDIIIEQPIFDVNNNAVRIIPSKPMIVLKNKHYIIIIRSAY